MNITIVHDSVIPAFLYGGTERVVWCLGKELAGMGHRVSFLVPAGSACDFADIVTLDPSMPAEEQIPAGTDIVHFHIQPSGPVEFPHIATCHGNVTDPTPLDINTVFVSRDHARRHASEVYVYNGLDWDQYGDPATGAPRSYYHFLGKAAWRVKNLKGAIDVTKSLPGGRLYVMGGVRFNFKMGMRFTFSPRVKFFGMVGGEEKNGILRRSKGLIFPVRWPEPFGLAITESMYFGAPVFGTPYGSLPELITPETGCMSDSCSELAMMIKDADFNPAHCHQYARDTFNSRIMAEKYLQLYERVLDGKTLNPAPPHALRSKYWPLEWKD